MEFVKKKIPSIGGKGAEVHFMQVPHDDEKPYPPFAIVCTASGCRWEGKTTTIKDMEDLQDMARVASEAWQEHLKLKPRIELANADQIKELGAPQGA